MNTQIYEEASEWFIRFRTGELDTAARKRFHAWLRTSPEHVRAYLELAAIWNEGDALDPEYEFAAPSDTDTVVDEDNVMSLTVPASGVAGPSGHTWTAALKRYAIAAMILLVIGTAVTTWQWTQRGVYATGIGQQHTITLADGSTVELNAKSRIRVRLTDTERDIDLLEGQALFRVAKDKARPFIVHSEDTEVRAVGTQFDVYRKATGTVVTVLEGKVAIQQVNSDVREPERAFLAAGEQMLVTAAAVVRPEQPNIEAATAWTQRRIIFESTPLAEAADELNRYNTRQLIIDTPALRDFRISGVFSSADTTALVRFLEARSGIKVTETPDKIRISAE